MSRTAIFWSKPCCTLPMFANESVPAQAVFAGKSARATQAVLDGETSGGAKAKLPGAGRKKVTERG